ncbi:hypothetical protein PG989_010377 [Apiospora arundinis]
MSFYSFDAADDDPPEQADSEAISDLYIKTMENFNQALLGLDSDPHLSDSPVLEVAFEECTRLRIWGLQNRVTLPENTPGSVAAHLKEQPELEQLVFEVLRDANSTMSRIVQEIQGSGAVSTSNTIKQDNDSDSSSYSDDSTSPSLIRDLKRVFENVAELYRLQDLFRLPRMKGKYLHSSQAQPDLPYYQQDYQHVRKKLEDWNSNAAPVSDDQEDSENDESSPCFIEPPDESVLSPESLVERQQAEERSEELTDKLCRRLAIANSKRRKQLRYWQSHPYQTAQQGTTDDVQQNNLAKRVNAMSITKEPASDHDAPNSEKMPTTVHSFSTAPRSAIMITERSQHRDDMARTTYQPSVVGADIRTTIRVPDIPRITAEKQFATRYDWKYHEMQMHHRQWDCPECQDVFENHDMLQTHLYHSHRPARTKRQVSILANMRERGKDDAALSICPLCSLAMQHFKLLDHVAGHLEEISLFALPKTTEFGDDDGKSKSNEAHGEHSDRSGDRDTMGWMSDEPSQISPQSLLRDLFFQAKRADRVANYWKQCYDSLGKGSFLDPERCIHNIRRSSHALRNIGDCIYFQGTSEVAFQYLDLILPSHLATLMDVMNFLKDFSLNIEEDWVAIDTDWHFNFHSTILGELQQYLTRSYIKESRRLGQLRKTLKAMREHQGLQLSPSSWPSKYFEEYHYYLPDDVGDEPHWAESLFNNDREDHRNLTRFDELLLLENLFNKESLSVNFLSSHGNAYLCIRILQDGLPAYSPIRDFSGLSISRESVDTILISEWDTMQNCRSQELARLSFATYEELVVFYCMFAALKAELGAIPPINLDGDYEIEMEYVLFEAFYPFAFRAEPEFPTIIHRHRSIKLEFLTETDALSFIDRVELEQTLGEATYSEMHQNSTDVPVVVDPDSE